MNKLNLTTLTIFFAFAFAASALAQGPAGGRIAVIDTQAFEKDGTGITKYVNAIKTVEIEFAPVKQELQNIAARIQTLEKEIKDARNNPSGVDQQAAQRKVDEYERLLRDYRFKEEDAKTKINRRFTQVTTPLNQAIGTALNEYGKQKGYAIILDLSRDTGGLIVAIPDEKIDITKDFIAFYNAKP